MRAAMELDEMRGILELVQIDPDIAGCLPCQRIALGAQWKNRQRLA